MILLFLFAEVDLRVGGAYRIQMKAPDGQMHTVGGIYREVVQPQKLQFTWAWEAGGGCGDSGPEESRETLVTVQFQAQGASTEVTLIHEQFADTRIS